MRLLGFVALVMIGAGSFAAGSASRLSSGGLRQTVEPQTSNHSAVVPGLVTRVITYHVETVGFTPEWLAEVDSALEAFADRCWVYGVATSGTAPERCAKFVRFTSVDKLKPYKREPTDLKLVFTKLSASGRIGIQIFSWDGRRERRVLNSDYKVPDQGARKNRFADLLVAWAFK